MALSTYADLKTQVQNWLARSDMGTGYAPSIDDLVILFEAAANLRLSTRRAEETTTLTPDANGKATLPSDFLQWRNVTWNGSEQNTLEYMEPTEFSGRFSLPASDQGQPVEAFTIVGNTLYVGPLDSTPLTLDYFGTISPLVNGVNWLWTNHPQVYLFGTLAEGFAAIEDFDKAQMWGARRDKEFDMIERLDMRSRAPSGIRITGPVV